MSADETAQIIRPPHSFRSKVPGHGGPSLAEIEAETERGLASIRDSYIEWAGERLDEINDLIESLNPTCSAKSCDQIARLSHDIKGTAGSFGYDLMTSVAALLHKFISKHGPIAADRPDILKAHVEAMTLALTEEARKQDQRLGVELLKTLEIAAKKASAKALSTSPGAPRG